MSKASPERLAALAEWQKTYVPASPCLRGHSARYVANSNCVECGRLTALAKYETLKSDPTWVAKNRKRARQWAVENPERAAARLAAWLSVPENLERKRRLDREWAQKNPEKAREHSSDNFRKWAKQYPEKAKAHSCNQNAARRNAGGACSVEDVKFLLRVQKRKCAACGIHLRDYHVDHILPIVLKGRTERANLQLLCPPCNQSKGGKHPIDWAHKKGRLL